MTDLFPRPQPAIIKEINRPLHLTLTILTLGVWGLVVWLPLYIYVTNANTWERADYQRRLALYNQLREQRASGLSGYSRQHRRERYR